MRTALLGIIAVIAGVFVWWRFLHVARPAVPPLFIDADDPLMVAAMEKARATTDRFLALYAEPHIGARCKVPFVSSTGAREFLWAEVRKIEGGDVEVLYLTPPVTHAGRLDRIHTHPLSDIVDWQIELPDKSYRGGFTMGVMFVRGREQWGTLPPALAAEEGRYVEDSQ